MAMPDFPLPGSSGALRCAALLASLACAPGCHLHPVVFTADQLDSPVLLSSVDRIGGSVRPAPAGEPYTVRSASVEQSVFIPIAGSSSVNLRRHSQDDPREIDAAIREATQALADPNTFVDYLLARNWAVFALFYLREVNEVQMRAATDDVVGAR